MATGFVLNYSGDEINYMLKCCKENNFATLADMKNYSDTCKNIKEGFLVTCNETLDTIYVYHSNNEDNATTGKFKDIQADLKKICR